MKKAILMIVLAAFLATSVGCIGIRGGTEQGKVEQSLGQQLIDLKKAKEEGAITDEEYEKLKEKLIHQDE
ncbi:MAG: SHOCT domain-containing protein [Desulfobacterales bacterium]|nr:MAG: SHOCT domain-containing protein [Desulfobacterales bacterium]